MPAAEDMQRKYKLPFGLIESIGLSAYTFISLTDTTKRKILSINSHVYIVTIPVGIEKIHTYKMTGKIYTF